MTEKAIYRKYVLYTNDEDLAHAEVLSRRQRSSMRGSGYGGWDMAAVADLDDPPDTTFKFCVFQIPANK